MMRLQNPKHYFRRLSDLEHEVCELSGVFAPLCDVDNLPPTQYLSSSTHAYKHHFQGIKNICASLGSHDKPKPRQLRVLLECCHIGQRILFNLERLHDSGFIYDRISVIVLDQRPSVARLWPIMLSMINKLIDGFSLAMESVASYPDSQRQALRDLTVLCEEFLSSVGLARPRIMRETSPLDVEEDCHIWCYAIQALNLALVLYTGTHLSAMEDMDTPKSWQETDTQMSSRDSDAHTLSFRIPRIWTGQTEAAAQTQYSCIAYMRRLKCLDKFLGENLVWVLHPNPESLFTHEDTLLLLSDSTTLGDIWGPMWEQEDTSSESLRITSYGIGTGSIVRSSQPVSIDLQENEVYSHWISDDELEDTEKQTDGFCGAELLMIGATPSMNINDDCELALKPELIYTRFKNLARTSQVDTRLDTLELDSIGKEVAASITLNPFSGMGISGSTKRTHGYKRIKGQTWKQALLESWDPSKENPLLHPKTLKA